MEEIIRDLNEKVEVLEEELSKESKVINEYRKLFEMISQYKSNKSIENYNKIKDIINLGEEEKENYIKSLETVEKLKDIELNDTAKQILENVLNMIQSIEKEIDKAVNIKASNLLNKMKKSNRIIYINEINNCKRVGMILATYKNQVITQDELIDLKNYLIKQNICSKEKILEIVKDIVLNNAKLIDEKFKRKINELNAIKSEQEKEKKDSLAEKRQIKKQPTETKVQDVEEKKVEQETKKEERKVPKVIRNILNVDYKMYDEILKEALQTENELKTKIEKGEENEVINETLKAWIEWIQGTEKALIEALENFKQEKSSENLELLELIYKDLEEAVETITFHMYEEELNDEEEIIDESEINEKGTTNVIFYPGFIKDIEKVNKEQYEDIKKTIDKARCQSKLDKNIKDMGTNSDSMKDIKYTKEYQSRLYFVRLDADTIYVINFQIKKDPKSTKMIKKIINAKKRDSQIIANLKEDLKIPEYKEKIIEECENVYEDINKILSNVSRI